MNRLQFTSLFLLAILLAGCKTSKPKATAIVDRSSGEIYGAIFDHNQDFDWFVADGSLKVDSPMENVSAKVYLRMKKDSIIWSVVKKVGVEGGRILATPKSYAIVNRIEGSYSRGSTSQLLSDSGMDLEFVDVQHALFGNIMLPDTSTTSISRLGPLYTVHQAGTTATEESKYVVNSENLQIEKVEMTIARNQSMSIEYSDYKPCDTGGTIPHKRKVTIVDQGMVSTIILDFKSISIDVPKSTKFSIPRHYEEVPSIY